MSIILSKSELQLLIIAEMKDIVYAIESGFLTLEDKDDLQKGFNRVQELFAEFKQTK